MLTLFLLNSLPDVWCVKENKEQLTFDELAKPFHSLLFFVVGYLVHGVDAHKVLTIQRLLNDWTSGLRRSSSCFTHRLATETRLSRNQRSSVFCFFFLVTVTISYILSSRKVTNIELTVLLLSVNTLKLNKSRTNVVIVYTREWRFVIKITGLLI